jgi:hypothetical protein
MSDRQGVEIDYCPKCRGVWLDRGELDKIIERSMSGTSQPQVGAMSAIPPQGHGGYPPQYGHHSDSHGHHYRKRSWLGEIFD